MKLNVRRSRVILFIWIFVFFFICIWGHNASLANPGNKPKGPIKRRPYSDDSPWNLKIGPNPVYDIHSKTFVSHLNGVFGSDATQFTFPVYEVTENTTLNTVKLSGTFSNVTDEGTRVIRKKRINVRIPIPRNVTPAKGTDAQIIIWNPKTGDEWGFWRVKKFGNSWKAVNGYHYNTKWSGVPPIGFLSRGAGVPYLAGLIRPWEIEQGHIDHAIAFGLNYPNMLSVYPATKSDGESILRGLPMGARLQLEPSLTDRDFDRWGLDRTGKIIARALQEYGMIVVDGSGHPKIYAEYQGTAKWNGILHKNTVRKIPFNAFRVLSLNAPDRPRPPTILSAEPDSKKVALKWKPLPSATRYRVKRLKAGDVAFTTVAKWITTTGYVDTQVKSGIIYTYVVVGVSYNGISMDSNEITILNLSKPLP